MGGITDDDNMNELILENKQNSQVTEEGHNINLLMQQRKKEVETSYQEQFLPAGFEIFNGWVSYQSSNDAESKQEPIRICSRLEVVARTRDADNLNHGRLLRVWDQDNVCHDWAMPMRLFASDGREYRAELLDMGLLISQDKGARSLLSVYIQQSSPVNTIRCVSQIGWSGDLFVLPHQTFGCEQTESVIFQAEYASTVNFTSSGTLEEFHELANLAVGNELMIFVISVAFASPLLLPLDMENGGFNIIGPSSIGKTKLLKLGASIWGAPGNVQQWRATSNGLEAVAQAHNDILLCLDELGQICAKDLGASIYMIGNGAAKARGQKVGGLRKQHRWRLLYLSSGELGIVDHIKSANQQVRVGQEIRAIDIQVGNRRYGCFDELHDLESGADFSLCISRMVAVCHGVAGKGFLDNLTQNKDDAVRVVKKLIADLKSKYAPKTACGQVSRVFERFALVAAAGELATALGVTGWKEGVATEASLSLFNRWLEDRGDLGNKEEQRVLENVSLFFEKHASSRFIDVNEPDARVVNCAGYRQKVGKAWEFYVYPEVYKKEICEGFPPKFVTEVCKQEGVLFVGQKGEACPTWRPPGNKSRRFYHFGASVLPQISDGSY